MRLIDADLLWEKITEMQACEPKYAFNFLNDAQNPSTEWGCIEDMIESIPVITEPVKHGRWFHDFEGYVRCSVCNEHEMNEVAFFYTYCPNCGARMDGGDADA